MTQMVRVGHPPGVYEAQDRWGAPSGTFYANEYGWMYWEVWERVQDFQTRAVSAPGDRDLVAQGRLQETFLWRETGRKILLNPERCTVWQLEVLMPGDAGLMRLRAVLGEPQLVEWGRWDAARLPWWRAKARRMSR